MERPDLNLLYGLAVLLEERSVTRASERLGLSSSATSRQLARLRQLTGDPLLVRAGRELVPTPRALALAASARSLVEAAAGLLRPEETPELATLRRTFRVVAGEGFVEAFGGELLRAVEAEAPGVSVHFHPATDGRTAALRRGEADLVVGVTAAGAGPELRTQTLLRDRFIGVVHSENPLAQGPVTAEAYASARHVETHRHAAVHPTGRVDQALAARGLRRSIHTVVAGFSTALALIRTTDHVATVPDLHTASMRQGLTSFTLPFELDQVPVAMTWHPRDHADPAHRWLRRTLRNVCAGAAVSRLGSRRPACDPPPALPRRRTT